jgi:small subunit ribosomal protein S17
MDAAFSAVENVAVAVGKGAADLVSAIAGDGEPEKKISKRAEKIGVVSSDKMMKTVTVRVDRLVKHPVYRKYVKKRKKFMAHDDLGAKIGDKVKIVETRPLSARKRWRVVEIIQKAEL